MTTKSHYATTFQVGLFEDAEMDTKKVKIENQKQQIIAVLKLSFSHTQRERKQVKGVWWMPRL